MEKNEERWSNVIDELIQTKNKEVSIVSKNVSNNIFHTMKDHGAEYLGSESEVGKRYMTFEYLNSILDVEIKVFDKSEL